MSSHTGMGYFKRESWLIAWIRMYNHIRTVAFWLDAAPLLSDLGLPFRVSRSSLGPLSPGSQPRGVVGCPSTRCGRHFQSDAALPPLSRPVPVHRPRSSRRSSCRTCRIGTRGGPPRDTRIPSSHDALMRFPTFCGMADPIPVRPASTTSFPSFRSTATSYRACCSYTKSGCVSSSASPGTCWG